MSETPDNTVLHLLREIRGEIREIRGSQGSHSEQLKYQTRRIDEVHETLYTAAGLAAHANVRHDTVAEELAELRRRVDQLEQKAH